MTHSIHGKEKYAVWCDKCKTGGPVRVYRMRAARDWNKSQQANIVLDRTNPEAKERK